jgi:hypothetical protein
LLIQKQLVQSGLLWRRTGSFSSFLVTGSLGRMGHWETTVEGIGMEWRNF